MLHAAEVALEAVDKFALCPNTLVLFRKSRNITFIGIVYSIVRVVRKRFDSLQVFCRRYLRSALAAAEFAAVLARSPLG